jgi:hypothetical protein
MDIQEYIGSLKKYPRSITMAINKKNKEIEHIIILRDEMVKCNIDNKLIQEFVDDQYKTINSEFEKKVKRYMEKENREKAKGADVKELKKKRAQSIDFMIKTKIVLEQKGISKQYIDRYMTKQYDAVNKKYNIEKDKGETIDFLD